jgi:nicotinamidase-related amidase
MCSASGEPEDVNAIYLRSGIGSRVGFGSQPALLIVDFQRGFTDPRCPVGSDLSGEIGATQILLAAARNTRIPIAYTVVGFDKSRLDGTTWLRKMPGLARLVGNSRLCEVDDRLKPLDNEPTWIKRAASAFFGTPLLPFLAASRVDTLILAGCTTSGCIRATAVDAVSFGYRTIICRECVGDRAEGPHNWNLLDIDAKYADVESLSWVLTKLRPMPLASRTRPTPTDSHRK